MDDMLDSYIEDYKENLITLQQSLMDLQNQTWNADTINRIFRVTHTIKGNSAAVEFHRLEKVMHTMEDILYEIRKGSRPLTEKIIQLLFVCLDFLEDCIEVLATTHSDLSVDTDPIMRQIKAAIVDGDGEAESAAAIEQEEAHASVSQTSVPLISTGEDFHTVLDICDDMQAIEVIGVNVTRGYYAYRIDITIDDETVMKSIRAWMLMQKVENEVMCVFSSPARPDDEMLRSGGFTFEGQMVSMLILSDNSIEGLVVTLKEGVGVAEVIVRPISVEQLEARRARAAVTGQIAVEHQQHFRNQVDGHVQPVALPTVDTRLHELDSDKTSAQHAPSIRKDVEVAKQDSQFIRIPVAKVDYLMDMLSELIIINSQLEQSAQTGANENTNHMNQLSRMAKIIKSVQTVSMSLRMVEIRPTLLRLTRIIRDTASELGKKVNIVLEGEDIEIDRGAADRLFDPLMHLVRNAVSHGIETEVDRLQAGKKGQGQITIKAYNKRGDVYIEVSDDGRGMDTRKIVAKAVALQLADESVEYSEEQSIRFIFAPGFSTQTEINNISGRGVGMNVVESEIKRVGGRIDVVNRFGEGCTFTLRIPMNLAVLNGTVVELAGGRYIVPTLFIREFHIVEDKHKISMQGQIQAIHIRESIIPILQPERLLGHHSHLPDTSRREYIILEMENHLLALPVDRVVGRQEVVSKPLSQEFAQTRVFSGASILGDGKVSLILDVEAMFQEMIV